MGDLPLSTNSEPGPNWRTAHFESVTVTVPDWTATITNPGCVCQPDASPGCHVIVCSITSAGCLVRRFIPSAWTRTSSAVVDRTKVVTDGVPITGVAPASWAATTVTAAAPSTAVTSVFLISSTS